MNLKTFADMALAQAIAKLESDGRMLRSCLHTWGKKVVIHRPVFGKDKEIPLGYETTQTELNTCKFEFQPPKVSDPSDLEAITKFSEEIYEKLKAQEDEWKRKRFAGYPKKLRSCCYELCDWTWLPDWTDEESDNPYVSKDCKICLVKYCVILPEV